MKQLRTQAPPAIRAELTGSDTCTALGVGVRANAPVLALCRALVTHGLDPSSPLEAYRGQMLCVRVTSIGAAAELEINAKGTGFAPSRAVRTGPPARAQRRPSAEGSATLKTHRKGRAHTNGEITATGRAS